MWILITIIILLAAVVAALSYACYNLSKKIEVYEDWVDHFRTEINNVHIRLGEVNKRGSFASSIDEKGIFENDDEIGFVFLEIVRIIGEFNEKIK